MSVEVRNALVTSSHKLRRELLTQKVDCIPFARKRVTVGIATRSLADQLVAHDLPALARGVAKWIEFLQLKDTSII